MIRSILNSSKLFYLLVPAVVVVGVVVAVVYFTRDDDDEAAPGWVAGKALYLAASDVRMPQKAAYTLDESDALCPAIGGGHFVLEAGQKDRELVAIYVSLFNSLSSNSILQVDQQAALLVDDTGKSFLPIDPCQAAAEVPEADPEDGQYNPFLWGSIELPQGYQVSGWMLFEVPLDANLVRLRWQETDNISADLELE